MELVVIITCIQSSHRAGDDYNRGYGAGGDYNLHTSNGAGGDYNKGYGAGGDYTKDMELVSKAGRSQHPQG